MTGRKSEGVWGGPEPGPNPPQHSHTQPPNRGAATAASFFARRPPPPAAPHLPRLSRHHHRSDPPRTPHPCSPAENRRPGPPRPSRRLPGIQWSGGKTRPNVPLGEGRETPPYPDRGPLPWPCSPPFGGEEGSGAEDGDFPAGGGEPTSPLLTRPLRPPPQILPGVPGEKRRLGQAGQGWMRKEATGSPPPHRP